MLDDLGLPEAAVVAVLAAMAVLVIWPAARICRRAGLAPWLDVMAVVPVANLLCCGSSRWRGGLRSIRQMARDSRTRLSPAFRRINTAHELTVR